MAKINLAMGAAIAMVVILRRPVRTAFHAPVAYALWLLVPAAMLASFLPPRIVAAAADPAPSQIPLFTGPVLPAQLSGGEAQFDWILLLFVGWVIGVAAMLALMARAQFEFRNAERQGL